MGKALRIVIGGISHETNSFSPVPTLYEDFEISRGTALLDKTLSDRKDGFAGIELLPIMIADALPSGLVDESAYLELEQELLAGIRAAVPVDGVYLCLHGAMEVESIGDAEGRLAGAVRDIVGCATPVSVSLDLHGNISPQLAASANVLTAYRTAPHRDRSETRRRALALLIEAIRNNRRPVSALVKAPLLLAGESALTSVEPARSLYEELPAIARVPGLMDASLLIGCAWTDSEHTCVSAIVVAQEDRDLAGREARTLAAKVWQRRREFAPHGEAAPIDQAIERAKRAVDRPVFISDSGDNVTAGGTGDLPVIAQRLLALAAENGLVAGLTDRAAVEACHAAGEGSTIRLSIGAKLDKSHGDPMEVEARVEHLRTGMSVVAVGGLLLLLTDSRRFMTDRAGISASGVDPMKQKIVVVKQGYLFPDLADNAPRAIMALSPGATSLQLGELPYRKIMRPVFPLDGDFDWEPGEEHPGS